MAKNYIVGKYALDDNQMQLLNYDTNTIVIAGAGSGKTLTIIGKINYLLENNITTPDKILIISFTNASVNDVKQKINFNVNVFTFHKLAMFILDRVNYSYSIASPNSLTYIIEEEIKSCSPKMQKTILKYLHLKVKFSNFIHSYEYQSFCKLIESFINLWKTNNLSMQDIHLNKYTLLEKKILLFIFAIYKKYIQEKNSINSLDFDDLILIATQKVKTANLNFSYIIIDEFQDTSWIRLNLIKEIVKYTNAKIIVVGDDWQSIYRFSGCDLNLFINFPQFFKDVKTIKLVNTYRNSQELITIASSFVLKNPLQIKKDLHSDKKLATPFIFCPYQNSIITFKKVLTYLLKISNDIMVLARNNKDIYAYLDKDMQYENNTLFYLGKEIKYYTVHRSKGLEAEYVILLNCNNEKLGFPNQIEDAKIMKKLYPNNEMKYAEERRLFYVAITRCKKQTYILYNKSNPSIFIKEIQKIIKKHLGKISYFDKLP